MNFRLIFITVACVAALSAASTDTAVRHTLTPDGAKKALDAAVAHAKTHSAPGGSIAVVDEGGQLMHFIRIEGSFPASANVAIGKARTAALFRKPTKDFEDIINKGRFTMTALPPDFTPLQGGIPILHDGQVVGAIGVSGAMSAQQDEDIAKAGAGALDPSKAPGN
jgi:uncharacterized protein GlcG (DUF336 family)